MQLLPCRGGEIALACRERAAVLEAGLCSHFGVQHWGGNRPGRSLQVSNRLPSHGLCSRATTLSSEIASPETWATIPGVKTETMHPLSLSRFCLLEHKGRDAQDVEERERFTSKSHISLSEHSSHIRLIGRGVPSVSVVSQTVYNFLCLASPRGNPQVPM